MAVGRTKTILEKSGDLVAYSELSLRNNAAVVEYCRTSMAALAGGTAGLLGLTGFFGFGFYIFSAISLWCGFRFLVLPIAMGSLKSFILSYIWGSILCFAGPMQYYNLYEGLLLLKAGSDWQKYFVNRSSLLTGGFVGGLFTYVLFWTFLYGMVHVY